MRSKLGDKVRLLHIIDASQEIESYIGFADFDTFLQNSMMRFSSIKQMEIIKADRLNVARDSQTSITITIQQNEFQIPLRVTAA